MGLGRGWGGVGRVHITHLLDLPIRNLLVVNPHKLFALCFHRRRHSILFLLSFPLLFWRLPCLLTDPFQVSRWSDPLWPSRPAAMDARARGDRVGLTAARVNVHVVNDGLRMVLRSKGSVGLSALNSMRIAKQGGTCECPVGSL